MSSVSSNNSTNPAQIHTFTTVTSKINLLRQQTQIDQIPRNSSIVPACSPAHLISLLAGRTEGFFAAPKTTCGWHIFTQTRSRTFLRAISMHYKILKIERSYLHRMWQQRCIVVFSKTLRKTTKLFSPLFQNGLFHWGGPLDKRKPGARRWSMGGGAQSSSSRINKIIINETVLFSPFFCGLCCKASNLVFFKNSTIKYLSS